MNLIRPISTELLLFYPDTLRDAVTLAFDLLTLESCHVMPLGRSIPVPLTVPQLGRLQFAIDRQLKVPIFTFFGDKGGQILNFIFLTPKRHYLGQNDV